MAIIYPISLPATPGPMEVEWGARTVGGRNVSPITLAQETFELPGNRWRVSVRYPRMTRAQGDAVVAALVSLYGVGTFVFGPAGAGKTVKGVATTDNSYAGLPEVHLPGQTGKALNTRGWLGNTPAILRAGDYFQMARNYLSNPAALDLAPWIGAGSAGAPVVIANDAPDPTGVLTAERIVFPATGAGQESYWEQALPFVPIALRTYYFSCWVRGDGAFNLNLRLVQSTGENDVILPIALTTAWQKFRMSITPATVGTGVLLARLYHGPSQLARTTFAWNAHVYSPETDARLHMVLKDVASDGVGLATLDIWPRLRESPIDALTLLLASPRGVFRLTGNEPKWDQDAAYTYGLSFEAEEAF